MASDNVANSNVFQRREGTGAAQILGNSVNPLMLMQQKKANYAQMAAARQKAEGEAKAARDKRWSELFAWNPDARWEPFDRQVRDATREMMDWQVQAAKSGVDPDSVDFRNQLRQRQDQINMIASKSNYLKQSYDEIHKTFSEDKKGYFNQNYYLEKLNDTYMDPNGNGHAIMNIDVNSARGILDDPAGYNIEAIASDFVDGLPEKLMEDYEKKATGLGEYFDKESFKSKLFVKGQDGKLKVDENGNPMLNLSPEVMRAAMQNTLIANYVNKFAEGDEAKKQALLRQILTPHDQTEISNTPTGVTKYDKDNSNGWGSGLTLEDIANNRVQNVYEAVNGMNAETLHQAVQDLDGIELEYTYPTGPGESGTPKEIVITLDQGFIPGTPERKPPKVIKMPIGTFEQKEKAANRLNNLIDEATHGKKVGADIFNVKWKEFTKNKKSSGVDFNAKEDNRIDMGINWNENL